MSDRKFRAFKNFLRRGSSRISVDSFAADTSALENTHSSSDDLQHLEENEIYMQLSEDRVEKSKGVFSPDDTWKGVWDITSFFFVLY